MGNNNKRCRSKSLVAEPSRSSHLAAMLMLRPSLHHYRVLICRLAPKARLASKSTTGAQDTTALPTSGESTVVPEVPVDAPRPPAAKSDVVSPPASREEQLAAQLERLQSEFAKELESRAQLQADMDKQAEELATLRLSCEGGRQNEDREAQLIREGKQLAEDLGRERETSRALLAEKRKLEAAQKQLAEELEGQRAKEKKWTEAKSLLSINEAALHEEISRLQTLMTQQEAELSKKAEETLIIKAALAEKQKLQDAELQSREDAYNKEIADREKALKEYMTTNESLRTHLRQLAIDHDRTTLALEKEVASAQGRAYAAEAQVSETVSSIRESLEELQLELRATESKKSNLQTQLGDKEKECEKLKVLVTELQTNAAADSASSAEKLGACRRHVSDLEAALRSTQQERDREKLKVSVLERQLREALSSSKERTSAANSETLRSSSSERAVGAASKSDVREQTEDAPSSSRVPRVASPIAHEGMSSGSQVVDFGAGQSNDDMLPVVPMSAGRMALAAAKMAAELKEAKEAASELPRTRTKLSQLLTQHDVLLQMYGQKMEEMAELRHDFETAKTSYKEQIDILSARLQEIAKVNTVRAAIA